VTSLTVKTVEFTRDDDSTYGLPENATLTESLPDRDIADAISDVVARADQGYALDLVTVLQVRARIAEDTGERVSLLDFAAEHGFDLAQLRAE